MKDIAIRIGDQEIPIPYDGEDDKAVEANLQSVLNNYTATHLFKALVLYARSLPTAESLKRKAEEKARMELRMKRRGSVPFLGKIRSRLVPHPHLRSGCFVYLEFTADDNSLYMTATSFDYSGRCSDGMADEYFGDYDGAGGFGPWWKAVYDILKPYSQNGNTAFYEKLSDDNYQKICTLLKEAPKSDTPYRYRYEEGEDGEWFLMGLQK